MRREPSLGMAWRLRHLWVIAAVLGCGRQSIVGLDDAGVTVEPSDAGSPTDGGDAPLGDAGQPDGGAAPDSGALADGGPVTDGGALADGGPVTDGGALADGGSMDGGSTVDGGLALGLPIDIPGQAPYDQWTWIPTPGAQCADGSPTGLGINPHLGATRLLVFLAGGGMCYDYASCFVAKTAQHLEGYDSQAFYAQVSSLFEGQPGVLRRDATNPFAADNLVMLPYCTGDIFSGNQVQVYDDPFGAPHSIHHVGHLNIERYLSQLVPTFAATASQVVFSGSSAGGMGAFLNYETAATAFSPVPTLLIDDSGPLMRDPYLTTALLTNLWSTWEMGPTLPAGCTQCSPSLGLSNLVTYQASKPGFRGSLISSEQDRVISAFLTIGNPLMQLGSYYQAGLADLYTSAIQPSGPGQSRVFFIAGSDHVWLEYQDLSQIVSHGTTLQDFLISEITPDAGFTDVLP